MLGRTGIVAVDIAERICDGLDTILREIEAGEFTFSRALDNWFNRQTTSIVMSSRERVSAFSTIGHTQVPPPFTRSTEVGTPKSSRAASAAESGAL